MANPWEFNWGTDDDQAPAQQPVAKPQAASPWTMNWNWNRAEQSAASQDYRRINPMRTIGQSDVANNLINEEYQAPELLHEDEATQDFVRPEGELFHARSFVPGAVPSQGKPLALEEPDWFHATAVQTGKGVGDMAATVATGVDGTPANLRRLPLDKTDDGINVADDTWSLTAKKITARAMRMAPMALEVMAGAMMGTGPTAALSTAVEGGAGGAMVGTWLQSAGPKFQAALLKYPGDPERAWQEAGNAALIDTGFAGAGGLLMGANLFSHEIANTVFQMFGLQPLVGMANMRANEMYTGDYSDQAWYDRYLENAGPGVLQTGAERIGAHIGLGSHEPGSGLPGGPDGRGGAGGDDHFIHTIPEALRSEDIAASNRRPASDYAYLDRNDPNYEPRAPRRSDGDNVTPLRYQKADEEPVDTRLRDINEQLPLKSREVFDNLKLTKAPMSDWHGVMLNKGVKPEELKDLGLTNELQKDPKKSWSRADIDALMKRNTPVFKEHLYSAAKHDEKRYSLHSDSYDSNGDPNGPLYWYEPRTGERIGQFATQDEAMASMPPDAVYVTDPNGQDHMGPLSDVGYSKWDKYTGQELVSPGVKNYEERVVQQNKERPQLKSLSDYISEKLGPSSQHYWSAMSQEQKEALHKEYERDVVKPWQDSVGEHQASRWNIGDTPGDHFGITNSVYHNRYGTLEFEDGVVAHHDDETQSDTIQKGRTQGFREESKTSIRNRADEVQQEFAKKHSEWRTILDKYAGLVEKLVGVAPATPSGRNQVQVRAKHLQELSELRPEEAAKLGYSPYDQELAGRDAVEVNRLQDEWRALDQKRIEIDSQVNLMPIVPHLDSWSKVSLKRMIQVALSKGLRHISWTTGEQQARRYGLENKINQISFRPADRTNPNGDKIHWTAIDKDGDTPIHNRESTFSDLADHVGSELAKKIWEKSKTWDPDGNQQTWQIFHPEDLKMGGEFHKKLYDKKKVEWAKELGKPFGFKPELKSAPYEDSDQPKMFRHFAVGDEGWNKVRTALKDYLTKVQPGSWGLTEAALRTHQEMEQMENQGRGTSADLVDYIDHEFSHNERDKLYFMLWNKVPDMIGAGRKVAIDHELGSDARRQMLAAIEQLKQKINARERNHLNRGWFNDNPTLGAQVLDDLAFTTQTPSRNLPGYFDGLREKLGSADEVKRLMRAIQHEQREMFGESAKPLFEMSTGPLVKPRQMWRMEITPKMGKQFRYQIAKDEEEARPGTLAVVHNISADALIHADRMGGLPAPSIGIVNAEHGMAGYGEISLLGHADLINPERSSHNKVYSNDIYSARYPKTGGRMDMSKIPMLKEMLADEIQRSGHLRGPHPGDFGQDGMSRHLENLHPVIMKFAREHGIIGPDENIMSVHNQAGPTPKGDVRTQAEARTKEVTAQVKKRGGFKTWIDRTFRPLFKEEVIQGPDGDVPHTMQNLMTLMASFDDPRAKHEFSSVGRVRAAQARQFKTLDEIRGASDRLAPKHTYEDRFQKAGALYNEVASSLADKVPEDIKAQRGKVFGSKYQGAPLMMANHALVEAARSGDVAGEIRRYIPDATDEDIAKAVDMMRQLSDLPTPYFEAKIMRPVGVDEFSAAVVPSNLREDAAAVLDKNQVAERIIYQHSDDPQQNELNRNRAIAEYKKLRLQRTEGGELTGNMDDLRKVSLTKERAAKDAPLMKAIIEEMQRIAPGVKVAFVERLLTRGADGSMGTLGGVNFGDMAIVALRNKDAMGSGRHESGHVVVDFFKGLGIFKPHEWEALTRYAKEKLFKKHEKFLSYYEKFGPDVMMSEAIVQELGVGRPTKFKGYPPIIRKMLYRMDGVLKAIRVGVHRVLGKKVKGEDVMAMLDAGHIGARAKPLLKKLGATATTDYGLATDPSGKVHYQVTPESKLDNIFDSALDIALGSTKLTRGHGAQWRAELIKQGVKPEELRDTGLEHLFTEFKDKPLTKDHVVNRREDNRTELHVIIKDDGTKPLSRAVAVRQEADPTAPAAPRVTDHIPEPLSESDLENSRFEDKDDVMEYIRDYHVDDEVNNRLEDYDNSDNPRYRYEHREYDKPTFRIEERDGNGEFIDNHGAHDDESDAEWELNHGRDDEVYFHGKPRQIGGLLTRLMGKDPTWVVDIHRHARNRSGRAVDIMGNEIDLEHPFPDQQDEYPLSIPDDEHRQKKYDNHDVHDEASGSTPEEAISNAMKIIRDKSRTFHVTEEPNEGYRIYDIKEDEWHEDNNHYYESGNAERAAERLNDRWVEEWSEQASEEVNEELNNDKDWWVDRAVEVIEDEIGTELDHDDLVEAVRHHWFSRRRNNNNTTSVRGPTSNISFGAYNLKGGGSYKREYLLTIPSLPSKMNLAPPGSTALALRNPDPDFVRDPSLPALTPREMRVRPNIGHGLPTHFHDNGNRNIMQHFRAQDFEVEDGGKAIVLEEDQSDPHQAARQAAKALAKLLGDPTATATGYGLEEKEKARTAVENTETQINALNANARHLRDLLHDTVNLNKGLKNLYDTDTRVSGDWVYGEYANWAHVTDASEYLGQAANKVPSYLKGGVDYLKEQLKKLPNTGALPNATNALVEAEAISRAAIRMRRNSNRIDEATSQLRQAQIQPDSLPHKDSWPMLALKAILHEAIVNGYDYVGMPTGAQQVERYPGALRTAIKKLVWKERRDGKFDLEIDMEKDRQNRAKHVLEGLTEQDIKNNLGAAGAKQIVQDRYGRNDKFEPTNMHVASGEIGDGRLEINNQGMMNFYDKTVQKDSKAFLAKMGLKWGMIRVVKNPGQGWHVTAQHKWDNPTLPRRSVDTFPSRAAAEAYAESVRLEAEQVKARNEEPTWADVKVEPNPSSYHEIHGIKITPEARQDYQTEITDKTGKVVKPANKMLRYQIADGETDYAARVARATTETPEFKRFFEGSVVKTPDGQPLKLYRGQRRNAQEDKFVLTNRRATPSFTPDPDVANVYSRQLDTKQYGPGSNVLPTYLSMKAPLDLRALGEHPSLGEVVELLNYDWNEPSATDQFKVGYLDIAEALRDMDTTVFRTNAEHDIKAGDSDGLQVRSFDELADLIEQLGEDGKYDELENALHDTTLDAYSLADSHHFVAMLGQLGYDGIIHKDVFDGGAQHYEPGRDKLEEGSTGVPVHDTYRPFEQEQIKSVHNTGTWNRGDKRILYQKDVPEVPVKAKYAKGDLAPADPKVNTPEFKAWWKKSKAIDNIGHPITVYHGSNHDITEFTPGNIGGFLGGRFYFTSNKQDASANYAGHDAPDFDMRAWVRAGAEAPNLTRDQLLQKAEEWKKANTAHEGAVYPFYLSLQNPLYIGGPNETRIPKSTVHAMLGHLPDAMRETDSELGRNRVIKAAATEWLSDAMANISHGSTVAASDFVRKVMQGSQGKLMRAIQEKFPKYRTLGDNPIPEVLRNLFEKMGYDGVIDSSVRGRWPGLFSARDGNPAISDDVVHYIAFHPNQIKSVNNTGSFSERMNHILYQMGDKFDTKYEDAPQGGRFLDTLRDGFANGKVDPGERATISDQKGDLERVYKKDWLEQRRGAPHLKQFAIMLHGKPIGRINGTVNGENMEVSWLGMIGGDDGLSDSSIRHLGAILRRALPRGVTKLTGLRKRAEQKAEQPPIRPQEPAPKPIPRITTTRGREDPLLDYYRDLGVDLGD
jgi:hypothetical protein